MSNINGVEIHDLFGLEEPTTKLIECVSAAIGKVYEPMHIKRMAKAKQKEIEIIGEAMTKNINLPSKYEDGKLLIDSTSADELIKRTGNRLLFTEMRKQQNIETIVYKTYKQLENEKAVTKEPIEQDWLFNFFNVIGDISNEDMQEIWSKILVGEIKKPNTYSLRTLSTLRNITTLEAKSYEKIVPFIFYEHNTPFLYNDSELLKKYNIDFSDLLKLEDCGLLNLNGFVSIDFNQDDNILYTDNIVLFIHGKAKIGVYTFTESGKQILNIIKKEGLSNDNYFLELCTEIKKNNKQINMNAYEIKEENENGTVYDNKKDLLSPIVKIK